ncbi:MAG TPA: gamma-glutamylcyclotransferase family protein [Candidatus Saccharimonadales bacterium]
MNGQLLYFAYGSNMDTIQMSKRCPSAKKVGVGYVDGWKFQYDGSDDKAIPAFANLVKSNSGRAWGVIYEMHKKDLEPLDNYESHPLKYYHDYLSIELAEYGHPVNALAYLLHEPSRPRGVPSKQYRDKVVTAAKKNKLPAEYISNILYA